MRLALKTLEEPYRARAVPPGSARYWSWLFAARMAREPLLGVYALMAEWRALMDPGTDTGVAQIKLLWWRDEIERFSAGAPVHPITRYLTQWPIVPTAFKPLEASIDAALAQTSGAPLELASELPSHADALYGAPLRVAADLAGGGAAGDGDNTDTNAAGAVRDCTAALAVAEYLARAVADYGRDFRAGRIPFPVDDLLAAQIDNDDLASAMASPRLQTYLQTQRRRAADYFATSANLLPTAQRPALRHLSVLAVLGAKHLNAPARPPGADFRLADLYNAWNTARRAAVAR